MGYEELENKINQKNIAIRYNVKLEGPAIKPEEHPEVIEILPDEEPFKSIALAILYEKKDETLDLVTKALDDKVSPLDIINNGLMAGINAVSALYTKGIYFLPDLMLSGDAMMEAVKECEKVLGHKSETKGTVVSFVAEGDPHDIGKNLILMFLRAGGYEAIDLGRDVPASKVVEAVKKYNPIFMTGTALMTTTMTAFPKVVDALKAEGLEVPAIGCGGGAVRKDYVESMDMTVYGVEAYHTPKLADAILKDKEDWKDLRKNYSEVVGEFVPEYA
ncbi:MAG: methanol--corrinoid protein MtaC [Methanobrevibacter wolinii]|uniref:methanol--corrinoid protein MtaC n=1 Tax=Methanobrevibacter wolinii TaxID=190977 RepID=UPI0005B2A231|nr:methanol--corrinoid protein MtaC [Methanobrevibacter wolinii]MDD5959057.1 methanol--corrinoid protein MtaC [Methanobrevibacter wolinii]